MAETATKRRTKTPKPEPAKSDPVPSETVPKQITFFQRLDEIPHADWGTRARVRVYRLEPLIDAIRSSGKKYITIYDDGPPTEERIKLDHGSGRYRLYLNMKTAGQNAERELDMIEIDIYDPKFPPRLELGDWIDDPKNRKWSWAKKMLEDQASKTAAAQPVPQSPNVLIDAMHVIGEVQKNAFEQARANAPATPADSSVSAFQMAKEMLSITKGGGDSTLLEMFRDELKAARQENASLQADFRKLLTPGPVTPPPAPVDPIDAIANSIDKWKKIQEAIGGSKPESDSIITPGIRSKMSGWQEFTVNILEKAFESPVLGSVLGSWTQGMFARSMGQTQAPAAVAPIGALPNPASSQPNQMQQVIDFLNTMAAPMLNMFGDGMDGSDFAEWLYEGHGETWMHPSGTALPWYEGAKQIGSPNLLQFFQRSPYWAKLQPQEVRFKTFLDQFVAWEIPKEDPAPATDSGAPEVINFPGNAI